MKIHDVEQRSAEWFAVRTGKPTASAFSRIVAPLVNIPDTYNENAPFGVCCWCGKDDLPRKKDGTPKTNVRYHPDCKKERDRNVGKANPGAARLSYARELAAEIVGGPDVNQWGGNMDLERGKFLEEDALSMYSFIRGVEVRRVGFITDDDETIGCSPDGLVGDDGMIEIKCLNANHHIDVIMRWHDKREIAPDYVAQPQGQMYVSGRPWCDVVFYHYALPPLIIRQTPDAEYRAALATGITEVIAERDRIVGVLHQLKNGDIDEM
jgi:hypothetical protein